MVLIYNLADTFFIGQTHDDLQVAAVPLATPVFLLFMSVGTVFGIGGTSVISRALGEGRRDYAKKVCSFCILCAEQCAASPRRSDGIPDRQHLPSGAYLHSGYVHSRCDLPRNSADLGAACGGCVVSAAGACTVHEELKKVDWQEIKKSLCRHPNWASAEALSYALKKLLYIVFAIRHPRRTFQQLLRRDFIELCKGNQIGGVGIAEAVLPRGNGLAADTQCFCHKLLRRLAADAFSFNASPRDLETAFFSSRTSLELTYFLSAFTIRIWKHGKKRTYVGTKVRRQHRLFVCRGLESGKKTKTIPVFYRML